MSRAHPLNPILTASYPDTSRSCSKNENVRVKAHGGMIDIQGMLIAKVNDKLQIQSIEVWYDPNEMFRQIGKEGEVTIVSKDETGSEDEGKTSGCPVAH